MEQNEQNIERSAGILLPVSSLPSPYGIGSFGKTAREWIDFLHKAGQSYWQILPLNPTSYGDSPYQSFSAFAGNPYFIDLDSLYEDGLLNKEEYTQTRWSRSKKRVDYSTLYQEREPVLRKAFSRFKNDKKLDEFIRNNKWFEHYSLFMVIKESHTLLPWMDWEKPLRIRDPHALEQIKKEQADNIRYHAFVQYQFDCQWNALRAYASTKNIRIIGDIPIYVSLDSADVWENHELFQLDEHNIPLEISGCPPDSFSEIGQIWGNPLYDWETIAKTGYKWWIQRIRRNFDWYDVLRLDHFRGLESYFAIPYGAKSAKGGRWRPGPGKEFIDMVGKAFPDANIIAEDLGFLTDEVRQLLAYSTYPGMKIIQYAFDDREVGDYIPHKYEANSIAYPGTHDNDTIRGWSRNAQRACIREAMDYIGVQHKKDLPRGMIQLAFESASNLAIIPMQDWLELGSHARLNTPSTVGGKNWRWRMRKKALKPELAEEIAKLTAMSNRTTRT